LSTRQPCVNCFVVCSEQGSAQMPHVSKWIISVEQMSISEELQA